MSSTAHLIACLALAISCASLSSGFLFGPSGPAWDGLRVTWNLNPFNRFAFAQMPRTVSDASRSGFIQRENYCQKTDRKFRGISYWTQNDPAVILLFDKNGYIAGIQTLVPKSAYTPSGINDGHPFVETGQYYALTAYFVDPDTICDTGRTQDQFDKQGTGDRLVIQNGTDPTRDQIRIPMTQTAVEQTMWTKGKCFWTMGLHYWYNVRKDMSCNEFFPFFLLYNKGQLNAFGFAVNTVLQSPRYEHPLNTDAKRFINPVPDCFFSDPAYAKSSSIHVYFTDSPRSTRC